MIVPFSPPHIDKAIINEVVDSLTSGWITTGRKTKIFEHNLARYCGNKRTLCVNSATSGLEIVLRWFGVGEGDEVIVPAYTYCATANVVMHCGATPVLIDSNEKDFNLDPNQLVNLITPRTKAILPVDVGGFPCQYDEIYSIINQPNIKELFAPTSENQKMLGRILILSDAAHSLGAMYKNRRAGTLSDITVFSFHAVKNLTTAEGGAIAFNLPLPFNNDEIYDHFGIITLHGQTRDAFKKFELGGWKYDIIDAGYKMNMPDVLAGIGIVELNRYEKDILVKRKSVFDYYSSELSKYDWAILPPHFTRDKCSSYHLYQLRIKNINEKTRDSIVHTIIHNRVAVNVHFQPLPLLTFYKKLGYNMIHYPNSYAHYEKEISLPIFYDITPYQMKMVIDTLVEAVEKHLAQ